MILSPTFFMSSRKDSLISMNPMKYEKYCHRTQVVSRHSFVSIGGRNILGCCEQYFIMRNKWRSLPSLNKTRYSSATALINQYIYAIGGAGTKNKIEVLDINKKD